MAAILEMINDREEEEINIVEDSSKHVSIVLSNDCLQNGNVVSIPRSEALQMAANIIVQIDLNK